MPDRDDDMARQPEGNDFAIHLRDWRRVRGFTQERLADASGLSVRAIRDMERGRVRVPQQRTASVLAEALRLAGPERQTFLALADSTRTRAVEPSRRDVSAAAGVRFGAPGELPPAIDDLTGRDDDLAMLSALAALAWAGRRMGPVIAVLHGPAGIGKTSLAVSAVCRAREHFPDGQLFVDLLGSTGVPLDPMDVLGRFLRSLGTPDSQIPALAERTALYRTVTHNRRLVVVLDNAADEGQVRPLLPAGAGCFVLVSSRRPLTGLEAAHRLALTLLTPSASHGLLRAVIGRRAIAEPDATAELVELCGGLPLALRIAANRLVSRPSWTMTHLVGQLRDQRQRLGALTAGDRSVRAEFTASYRQLTATAAVVFRRSALLASVDFGVVLAAVTVDLIEDVTASALEELIDSGLLLAAGERYRFHELVRLFAEERLAEDEPAHAATAARQRMISWLLERTAIGGATFEPSSATVTDSRWAGAWLDQEFAHWWYALRLAAQQDRHADVVRVVRALRWYSGITTRRHPWDEVFRLGLDAAEATGDRRAEAALSNSLGWALYYCGERYADALALVQRARSLARECGDRREEAWALTHEAAILVRTGDPAAAVAYARQSASLFGEAGYRLGAMCARSVLAKAHAALGNFAGALDMHQEVLAFHRGGSGLSPAGRLRAEAVTLTSIGLDLAGLSQWAAAARAYAEAVDHFVRAGDEFGEGRATYYLALANREVGDEVAATAALRRAVERFVAAHDISWVERARQALHHD